MLRAHDEKARFFGKDNSAGKIEGSRERGGPNMRRMDSRKEATGMSLPELS